ncbi:MAG TPA: hypothetical protein PKK94_28605, partial [Leptospiraceae bacterium]|nr:hypothetical protein [Leptospiraceae bacterium]
MQNEIKSLQDRVSALESELSDIRKELNRISGNSSVQEIPKAQQFAEEKEESASDGFFSGLKKKSLEN